MTSSVDCPVVCSVHGRVKRLVICNGLECGLSGRVFGPRSVKMLVICNDLECGWSGRVFGPRSGQKVSDM